MKQDNTTQPDVIELFKKAGLTCRSCWWQEGGRCYLEPCERIPNPDGIGSISTKRADNICQNHTSKRSVLGKFFGDKLVITSEETAQKQGKDLY